MSCNVIELRAKDRIMNSNCNLKYYLNKLDMFNIKSILIVKVCYSIPQNNMPIKSNLINTLLSKSCTQY